MATFIQIIANNLLGYDSIIVLLAIFSFWSYGDIWRQKSKIAKTISIEELISDHVCQDSKVIITRTLDEEKVIDKKKTLREARKKIAESYSLFHEAIGIFSLLGILGTVIGLIPMVGNLSDESVTQNFFIALTSTFWGLIFTITFKILDAKISPQIEQSSREIEKSLELLDERKAQKEAE